jgi:hypothetical protein
VAEPGRLGPGGLVDRRQREEKADGKEVRPGKDKRLGARV